ncbi:glutaminyl-peptide cyclotransferase [Rhodococcus sp. (in: high G+C Gram-positive bacteria)]|uniref:glutaminyl-peptide cyclotransferase n=1 Tax=unclassified Rhodococcus (in: high G+C Gram-positive bacteria) TaxID=192944 RepID=UPI001A0F7B24|nr:glutaminyl-peptide cyclotransferase [Rhodococcus sp. (in: high G+C Gram-positive bacteria)]MBF0663168.1 glutaminyl-peptide cyclotransferase [Rhodococcus sp. (in: high G+C Gram-positive bacteria)]
MRRLFLSATLVLTAWAAVAGCADRQVAEPGEPPEQLRVEVLATHPHDPGAFTQGLEVDGGELLEGTGLEGRSWLSARPLDTSTVPAVIAPDDRTRVELDDDLFGEGITVAGDTVWQLTWKDGVALARDRDTLGERRRVDIDGEGWGLCARSDDVVMSDGSSELTFRDPVTFAERGQVTVHRDGRAVSQLNELECAEDGTVYANVWKTDEILRIDPATGRVEAQIDASALRDELPAEDAGAVDVLNGIAQIPGTDRFLVTGKYWPALFEVRFVP